MPSSDKTLPQMAILPEPVSKCPFCPISSFIRATLPRLEGELFPQGG